MHPPLEHTARRPTWERPTATGNRADQCPATAVVSGVFWIATAILVLVVPLLVAPRAPWISGQWAQLLGVAIGGGNFALHRVLRQPPTPRQRLQADLLLETIGWTLCVGILWIWVREADSLAPIALLGPLVSAAALRRRGWLHFGRVVGVVAALLGAQAAIQLHLEVLDRPLAISWGLKWLIILGTLTGIAGYASWQHERQTAARAPDQGATPRDATGDPAATTPGPTASREPVASEDAPDDPLRGLTRLQRSRLPYLVTDCSHEAIAVTWGCSTAAVKTAQREIAKALGVPTGAKGARNELRAAARDGRWFTGEQLAAAEARIATSVADHLARGGAPPAATQPADRRSRASESRPRVGSARRSG